MKVLVTGDPEWKDMARVRGVLRACWDLAQAVGDNLTVAHLNQEGVDQEVDRWARRMDGIFQSPGMSVSLDVGNVGVIEDLAIFFLVDVGETERPYYPFWVSAARVGHPYWIIQPHTEEYR